MNMSTAATAVKVTEEHVQALREGTATIETVMEMGGVANLEEQISQLTMEKTAEYFTRRTALEARIRELTDLDNQEGLAMAKADLESVEVEIAKRAENVGMILSQIAQKLGYFKDLGTKLLEDSPEDVAKRQAALDAVQAIRDQIAKAQERAAAAETDRATAETSKTNAEADLKKAQGSWNLLTKGGKINTARAAIQSAQRIIDAKQSVIDNMPDAIADLNEQFETAQTNIVSVEEQIKVDKEHRIQTLSLDSLYGTLTEWESKVFKIIEADIDANQVCIGDSETALKESREFGIAETRRLKGIEESIATLEVELDEKQAALKGILDHESEEYFKARDAAKDCAMRLDELNKESTIVRGNLSKAEVKIAEHEASLMAMKADLQLQKRNYNDFALDAEAARSVGNAIAQLIKNQTGKTVSDSLSRSRDAMTLTVVDVSLQNATATVRSLADRAERGVTLLDKIQKKQMEGDANIALQEERLAKAEDQYRKQYGGEQVFPSSSEHAVPAETIAPEKKPAESVGKRTLF